MASMMPIELRTVPLIPTVGTIAAREEPHVILARGFAAIAISVVLFPTSTPAT